MKHFMKPVLSIAILILTFTTVQAQQQGHGTSFQLDRSIKFDNSSESREIKVDVQDDTDVIHLSINSSITSGTVTIELYDPKGEKVGNFTVESSGNNSGYSEEVCGQFNKHIENPRSGSWVVKIKPAKASGKVYISTNQCH